MSKQGVKCLGSVGYLKSADLPKGVLSKKASLCVLCSGAFFDSCVKTKQIRHYGIFATNLHLAISLNNRLYANCMCAVPS